MRLKANSHELKSMAVRAIVSLIIMKKKKSKLIKLTKESPEARKKRVSSGVKFRASVFEDKRRKQQDKKKDYDDLV